MFSVHILRLLPTTTEYQSKIAVRNRDKLAIPLHNVHKNIPNSVSQLQKISGYVVIDVQIPIELIANGNLFFQEAIGFIVGTIYAKQVGIEFRRSARQPQVGNKW